ncbi:MAG: nucleoside permease [Chlorobi bacterium]|nr:nucleoside permease [Chlorobiota bacterium]
MKLKFDIKLRLIILNFLEFFVFGAWLLSFGKYMHDTLKFSGEQIGLVFMTLGLASLLMPGIMGVIADKWLSPNKLFALSHIIGAGLLVLLAQQTDFQGVFWVTLFYLMLYMPTIALDNTISYCLLTKHGYDVVKTFPPIRVWGTIGFIIATWITDLMGWGTSPKQFYFAAAASLVLGLYTFTLPDCPPQKEEKKSLAQALGLDALKLFKDKKMALFFLFSMLLGAALQITNMWGEAYLHDFGKIPEYREAFIVKYNGVVMSLSQISETLFILTIPFFLKRYGIKTVMLMSMIAWFLRFGLFAIGSPVGIGAVAIILSMIVYGMAFDFFNISGSLFVEKEVDPKIRASAQGLFMIMTNGIGAMLGAYLSGVVVDMFREGDHVNWRAVWAVFALYALIVAILFAIFFKYEHKPEEEEPVLAH